MNLRRLKVLLLLVLIAIASGLPFILDERWMQIAIVTANAIVVAIAWNILATTGQISLGHAGFFGVGAYVSALSFLKLGIGFFVSILLGAVGAAVIAMVLGAVCLRMRGIYLAITTLAFAEALRGLAIMLPGITNGAVGLSLPRLFSGGTIPTYYAVEVVLILSLLTAALIKVSAWGYAFSALRGNEEAAGVLGINPVKYKMISFLVSAFLTGIAGGFYAFFIGYIIPHEVFNPFISIKSQIMPLVGGLYTIPGPVIGGVVLGVAGEYLRSFAGEVDELIYGALLIMFVLLWPKGIAGFLSRIWDRFTHSQRHEPGSVSQSDGEPAMIYEGLASGNGGKE